MMSNIIFDIFKISLASWMFLSCVPPKLYSELEAERNKCKDESTELWTENEQLTVKNTELKSQLDLAAEAGKRAEEQYLRNTEEFKLLKDRYKLLNERYDELQNTYHTVVNGSDSEARELMSRLDNTQKDLYQKEDQLTQLQLKLDHDRTELDRLKKELETRNARLIELEEILNRTSAETEQLRSKVATALMGFENKGLTVTKKNGKVYVSLDEKLLFKSGSTEVDAQGKAALKKLAKVLEQNTDINITIEGHTDNVPVIPGSKYADNWDLSVNRATVIIRILLENSTINPSRLTASGRGEFMPVDRRNTEEARQANRRTEIILTPNLDEILKIIEN
ncbi:MAG: OmpA family protein [Bacteroidales bacterium]|nr:OmpA family protein [Bacteroidales bacterium]